jgi:hypothetical protein
MHILNLLTRLSKSVCVFDYNTTILRGTSPEARITVVLAKRINLDRIYGTITFMTII